MLDGMFSFVLLDTRDNSFIVARDAIGITPLYIGWGLDGKQIYFSASFCTFICFSMVPIVVCHTDPPSSPCRLGLDLIRTERAAR